MSAEQMLTEVIHKFGFEHPLTIMFAKETEQRTDGLEKIYSSLMEKSIEEEG